MAEAGRIDPLRTCIACRQRAERGKLLRVALLDQQLVADDRARLPGRGAWVHPTAECLKQAVSRGSFARALRVSGLLDTGPLENRLEKIMDN